MQLVCNNLSLGLQNYMKCTDAKLIFEMVPDSGGTYFSEIDNNPFDSCDSSEVYNQNKI